MVSKSVKVTTKKRRRVVREAVNAAEEALRDYEMVLIISPEASEEESETILSNVSKIIDRDGGGVSHVERWGKRKLAYPIGHFTEGSYVLTRFKLKPSLGTELEVKLQISEDVLRYLLIRLKD